MFNSKSGRAFLDGIKSLFTALAVALIIAFILFPKTASLASSFWFFSNPVGIVISLFIFGGVFAYSFDNPVKKTHPFIIGGVLGPVLIFGIIMIAAIGFAG